MSVLKTFNIALDTKKALYGDRITLVESDTGNRFVITLTDDGDPVNLTGCRVAVVFSGAMGTAMQTSWSGTGQVTIGGDDDNEITVDVLPASYANGLVTCEIQVYSGESYTTLVTSAAFTFNGRKPIVDENTLDSSTEYPILVELINQVEGLTTREQSDWEQTDGTQGNYIQNKPVAGTGFQDATQNLIEETSILTTDIAPMYRPTGTAHHFKATVASWIVAIRTAIFGTTSGMLKANGSGVISAAVSNTDYAAATHASRHSVGGDDALSGYATLNANSKVTATQASAYVNTQTDSYTLALGDAGGRVHMNKATANDLTVPPNSSVAFPVGTEIEIKQIGAGQTTIVAGSGVTLRNADTALKIEKQWCSASLIKLATDEWCVDGRTVA
jgi:hypothetical protein